MKKLLLTLCLTFVLSAYANADIVGPGDNGIDSDFNDGDSILVISDDNTSFVTAGTYTVSGWEYIFQQGRPSDPIMGSDATPFLAIGPAAPDSADAAGDFTIIAVGDLVTAASDATVNTFGSPVSFGTNNTFTLASDATVYAGFYSENAAADAPIAVDNLNDGVDRGFILFGSNVNAPVVGAAPSGGGSNGTAFSRHYDFQITFDAAAVPEPGGVLILAFCAIATVSRRKRI